MLYIFRKVQIIVGKSTSDIIIHLLPGLSNPLKLRHDQIVAALTAPEGPHPVVNLPASVDAAHHIGHLPIGKLQYLLVQQHHSLKNTLIGCPFSSMSKRTSQRSNSTEPSS